MTDHSASTEQTAVGSPVELVEAYIAAWNSRDGAAVVDSLAPGGTYVDPFLPGPVSGDDLAGYVNVFSAAFPDFVLTIDETLEAGRRVAVTWTITGTYTGPMPGLPGPTGASFILPAIDVIEVGPEGITSVVGYIDQLTFLRQLGIDVNLSVAEPEPSI